ncbi:hypothetical protein QO004_005395 [Rhizobium mesoamericanum]|nr:hypothetical protein [Rhizobium mesoamericanum]
MVIKRGKCVNLDGSAVVENDLLPLKHVVGPFAQCCGQQKRADEARRSR